MKKYVYGIIIFALIVIGALSLARPVQAEAGQQEPGLRQVDVTAYYDYLYHWGISKDGRPLVEGLTIAGPAAWMGYTVALYDLDMNFIGYFEVRDTGYGRPLGWKYGASQMRKGSSIGDIEAGLTLDLYFDSKQSCIDWGRRKCYMKLIKSEG